MYPFINSIFLECIDEDAYYIRPHVDGEQYYVRYLAEDSGYDMMIYSLVKDRDEATIFNEEDARIFISYNANMILFNNSKEVREYGRKNKILSSQE